MQCEAQQKLKPFVLGKTILASVVIAEAEKRHWGDWVAYFYCKSQYAQMNNAMAILRDLLLQRAMRDPDVVPFLFDRCSASAETKLESLAVLRAILRTVLLGTENLAIVIDGLDACAPAERHRTLSYLLPVVEEANRDSPGSVRLLFTSQDVADLRSLLRKAEVMTLTAQDNAADIRSYTEYRASQIQARFDLPHDEVRRITERVTQASMGKRALCICFVIVNICETLTLDEYRHVPLCQGCHAESGKLRQSRGAT
jgi:hypothetical protein